MLRRDSYIDDLSPCKPDVPAIIEQGYNFRAHAYPEGDYTLFGARFYVDYLSIGKEASSAIQRVESPLGHNSIRPEADLDSGVGILFQDSSPCSGQRKIKAISI